MSDARREPLRRIFEEVDKRVTEKRWVRTAIVSKVRKKDRKIKVKLLPELIETNWLKVFYPFYSGDGYFTGALPPVDSEVVILFIEGHSDGAFVLGGNFAEHNDSIPEIDNDYDIPIMDKFGNKIVLTSSGIEITSTDKDIKINAGGTSNVIVNDGQLPVARQTDLVSSPFGPLPITTVNQSRFKA